MTSKRSKISSFFKKIFFVQGSYDFTTINNFTGSDLIVIKDLRKSYSLGDQAKEAFWRRLFFKKAAATPKTKLTLAQKLPKIFFKKPRPNKNKIAKNQEAIEILHGLDLTIKKGEILAIMGTSGSGKSTLMNIIGTLDRPTSGTYYFAGVDTSQLSSEDLSTLRRENIGFVFQSFNLLSHLSVSKNIARPLLYARVPKSKREQKIKKVLEMVNLSEKKDSYPLRLSGGQQQRVAIARALVMEPSVIFADEPTGALDSKTAEKVMSELQQISRQSGTTIIIVTHDQKTAGYADRIINLQDGQIIPTGKTGIQTGSKK